MQIGNYNIIKNSPFQYRDIGISSRQDIKHWNSSTSTLSSNNFLYKLQLEIPPDPFYFFFTSASDTCQTAWMTMKYESTLRELRGAVNPNVNQKSNRDCSIKLQFPLEKITTTTAEATTSKRGKFIFKQNKNWIET